MTQKILTIILLIFSLSIFSFAQTTQKTEDQKVQKPSGKQKKKRSDSMSEITRAANFLDLSFFLPDGKTAWALSLTSTGGFAGGTRLLAAVNSNGNYLCSPRQEFKNRLLKKDILDPVFNFVETLNFSKLDDEESVIIEGCMDCAYTTLTLQTRNGVFRHTRNSFYNATGEVKEIYDRLSGLDECK